MLKRIEITAFKSLVQVTVELGRVNVFIGANGSGKSNLLEAIAVLGAAAAGRVDHESLLYRGVRMGPPAHFGSGFADMPKTHVVRFLAESRDASYAAELVPAAIRRPSSARWHYQNERLVAGDDVLVDRSTEQSGALDPASGLAALEAVRLGNDPAAKLLETLRAFCIYTPNTPTLRDLVKDLHQEREPVGLLGGRLPEAFREMVDSKDERLGEIVDTCLGLVDWIKGYGRVSGSRTQDITIATGPNTKVRMPAVETTFYDRFMETMLTPAEVNEGLLYLLFIAVVAAHPLAPLVCAIDNMDHGLNPRLARTLMEHVCEWVTEGPEDKQLLLTTQNPLVIDGLPLLDDRIRLFTVDRDNRGHTVIERVVVDEALMEKAREGWTLSRLWVMGHLGGVPNV